MWGSHHVDESHAGCLNWWMSPSTLGVQSMLPGSRPMEIQTSPELPQREVSSQRPHSNPHSFVSVSVFFVFIHLFIVFYQKPVFYFVLFLFCSWPQKLVFMDSGEEIGPFLTRYFFRPQYLSIANITVFDRALLLISGDIEDNPGSLSFDIHLNIFHHSFPFPTNIFRVLPLHRWDS